LDFEGNEGRAVFPADGGGGVEVRWNQGPFDITVLI
jgi:hypothetical protein